jgi:hydroxymethylpyrimidine pyrophosphatase-like HAD family hydrolase
VAFDIGETQKLDEPDVAAIADAIRRGGARFLRSTVHAHAFVGDYDKARMAARVCAARFGASLDELRARWLFVGDSPNDQAGFATFPISVGVANVARFAAVLAPPPAFVTVGAGGHGFAELMALILAHR